MDAKAVYDSIRVAGHWELSWNAPIKEAELWNLPLRTFGIKNWYMWPVSGIQHNEWQKVDLHERQTFEEILEENQDIPRVYVEPFSLAYPQHVPADLREFEHPQKALYVFGSAHYNPVARSKMRDQDQMVMVPSTRNQGVLWPHQCMVTVFYDRLSKGWL